MVLRSYLAGAVLIAAIVLSSCAYGSLGGTDTVLIDAGDCLPSRTLRLTIRNAGTPPVAFAVYDADGPPWQLQPAAVTLLDAGTRLPWAAVLDHSRSARHEAKLGAGDEAAFVAEPAALPSPGDRGAFVLELRDLANRVHYSALLRACNA